MTQGDVVSLFMHDSNYTFAGHSKLLSYWRLAMREPTALAELTRRMLGEPSGLEELDLRAALAARGGADARAACTFSRSLRDEGSLERAYSATSWKSSLPSRLRSIAWNISRTSRLLMSGN